MSDRGLTHVALPVSDLEASLAFYERYAGLRVVHRRQDEASGSAVAWIGDGTHPFVVVLIQASKVEHPLLPIAHLGVGCASREEVDERARRAREAGLSVLGPTDSPPPVGYWVLISDPDRHTLELSHGQEVRRTVASSQGAEPLGRTGAQAGSSRQS